MLIPRRDLEFQVFDVLGAGSLTRLPRYAEHDRAVFDGVFDTAYRIAAERFAPFAAACDIEEPRLVDGRAWTIPETRAALAAYNEASFTAAAFDAADGGLQLPLVIAKACTAVFSSANVAFHSYAALTAGAANLLATFGSEEQRRRYLRPMLAGRFTGTMCLSEPHAGSSLTDIRCQALRQPDGSYLLTGSKMWISGGDHDLAETIVHLVLAKVPGGPPGVKGISLFVVPRDRIRDDGSVGPDNDVRLAGLNHKMGWRGTTNCVLSFGDHGRCRAEIVGEEHHGLRYMFQMMNAARLGVGMNAVALGYAAYGEALDYARERPQGRPPSSRDPASPPVPIIRHADVRRMLLAQKAWVEGGLALVLYCAWLQDHERCATDAAEREHLNALLELLTPIAKSWPSEFCLEANKLAIQVHGGYGYTRDYPVERLYRDNRLNHIHEGTHGIHGLDLLGRKVTMHGGAALKDLFARIGATVDESHADPVLAEHAAALAAAAADAGATALTLVGGMAENAERALANATLFLDAMGHVVVAWRWLVQAQAALRVLPGADATTQEFCRGKLAACRFFFRYELPKTRPALELLRSLDDTAITIPDAGF
ncbi:MAG TPA: acyl-CoA dehydrogenase [Steroidobacteraceae bacterium]|nr:acyl-CoA dehydrogenase [Steroidobacteraceae bacterium]